MRDVEVPRSLVSSGKTKGIDLHLFSDASTMACRTAAIAVVEDDSGKSKGVLNDVIVRTSRDPRVEKHVVEKRTFRTFVIFCSKSVDVFRQIYRSKEQNLSVVY